ncbi:MAG: mechanosensitive ion channel family protein [Wenzhouxiangellaceae bacterium]
MNLDAARIPDWLPEALHPAWAFLATYPAALALAVALLGLGLAFIVRWILLVVVMRAVRPLPGELADRLLAVIANVGALIIGYLALVISVRLLGLPDGATEIAIRLLMSVLVLQLMRHALRAGHIGLEVLGRIRDRYQIVEERTLPLFDLILTVVIIAVAAYALLQVWNIDPTAWLASAGVIGIAVGFAARDTLANLFAGFFIIADAPYKNGDYVVLDTGERGEVTKVGMRSTRILTRDDVEVTVPNSTMANSKIVNQSGGNWERFRIRLKVGVAYGSDVDQVVALLERLAVDHDTVCDEPAPRVRMRGFGDSSLDFELLCWVDRPANRGLVSHQLYMKIYKALNDAEIEIPFPQHDVWMRGDSTGLENSSTDEHR